MKKHTYRMLMHTLGDILRTQMIEQVSVGVSISSYIVEELLGSGGMGAVYRAVECTSGRKVALKILRGAFTDDRYGSKRFFNEARAVCLIDHPSVARIYEVGESNGLYFIAMELIEGSTLFRLIQNGPLPSTTVISIAKSAADVLAIAHSIGILHRDIKPSNIMITPAGSLKLLDFGLAKLTYVRPVEATEDELSTIARTRPNLLFGTVPYFSPEQALGKTVDRRSDIFSLGVTLFHAATGRLPFEGRNIVESMDQLLHKATEFHTSEVLDPKLRYIICKCMEKNPDRRYQSAPELLCDLQRSSKSRYWRQIPSKTLRLKFALFLGFIVALLLFVYWQFGGWRQQPGARYSQDQHAYQLYLKGRQHWNRRTPNSIKEAIKLYEAAIQQDGSLAVAYAGLALAQDTSGVYTNLPPTEFKPKAMKAALKALALDPTLAEAHTTLASILGAHHYDWYEAEREFKKAIELDPGFSTAHKWYAELLLCTGRFKESEKELRIAQRLEPTSLIINQSIADPLFYSRQFDRGIQHLTKVLQMDSEFQPTHYLLGELYEQKKMYAQAIKHYEKALSLSEEDPQYVLGPYGRALARSGLDRDAEAVLKRLRDSNSRGYVDFWYIALVHAGLNQKDEAFAALEKAWNDRSAALIHLKVDPSIDNLRDDPRYLQLIRNMGLPN